MFWKKKETKDNKTINHVIDALRMIEVRINSIEADVEGLRNKFKKKLLPKNVEDEGEFPSNRIQDGFDELRKLNK